MGYDGWVVVGTKLDSKQLEKDLKQAERKLQQYEKEAEKLTQAKVKAEIDLQPYEEQKRLIQEATDEMLKFAQTEQEVTNLLSIEKKQLDELDEKYSKQLNNLNDINFKIQENAKNQGLVTNEINETNKKLNQAKRIDSIKDAMESVNKSTNNAIKKVGRWALAVFGVRSAYMFVRNAVSTLSQYNEQIATDLEYMRFAIASGLQPLIERLIKLCYQLLIYADYLANAWFGVSLFANASADAMNKSAKSAEKMKKSLAGFDEMNVLNDNGTTGAMGTTPSIDLTTPEDVEIPSWLQWIVDNKDVVIAGLSGIAGGLFAVKLGFTGIQSLGIGIALSGIVYSISALKDYLNDTTWENFGKIFQGISVAVIGLGVAFGGLPVIIVGAIILIYGTVLKYWDKIKGTLQGGIDWLKDKSDWIRDIFGDNAGNIYDSFVKNLQLTLDWFDFTFKGIKDNFNELINFVKNVFSGNWAGAWQNIKNIFKNIWEEIKYTAISIGTGIGNVISATFKNVVNGVLNAIESILNKPIKTTNSLITTINKVPGINLSTLPTFNLPRLAVGGVVNMPGRGINYAGANIGERGAEGVIPLTNSQMMEQLGQAIGKYININATVPVYVGNRQIAREIKKINADSNFAFNE